MNMTDEPNGKLIRVRHADEVDGLLARLETAAQHVQQWALNFSNSPLEMMRMMKFDAAGVHPITMHPLNMVEQINQTWTYMSALLATRKLFELHPEAGGFRLAPGAHASQPLDIMSEVEGAVGAETFAAVHPRNNNKLAKDMTKLLGRAETHRYIFFISPLYSTTMRLPALEKGDVQVWSLAPPA